MTQHSRADVHHRLVDEGLLAEVRVDESEPDPVVLVADLITPMAKGGISVVALQGVSATTFALVHEQVMATTPSVALGARVGVQTAAGAGRRSDPVSDYLEAGADLIWSDELAEPDLRACHRSRVAYLPTCPGEDALDKADEWGVEIAAMPASAGIRELLRRRPRNELMVVDGGPVKEGDLADLFGAGAAVAAVVLPGGPDIQAEASELTWWARKAKGQPLFGPVEHTGVYAREGVSDDDVAEWYSRAFGYPITRGKTLFAGAGVFGRVEILKEPLGEPCHLGIRVGDFEAAVADLHARGFPVVTPVITERSKLAYLADRDPSGNLVHIIWRPS